MTLARHTPGQITGLDFFLGFVERFNHNARVLNLQERVKGIVGSMDALPFEEEELDLIWSEGAIYNIGFERGLNEWRKYLKTGGYVAVSESSWFTEERPAEIHDFWMSVYAEIDTIPNKVAQVQKAGYIPVATFILPEYCWTENYFALTAARLPAFLEEQGHSPVAVRFAELMHEEAAHYRQYGSYYGYVFYIGRKR